VSQDGGVARRRGAKGVRVVAVAEVVEGRREGGEGERKVGRNIYALLLGPAMVWVAEEVPRYFDRARIRDDGVESQRARDAPPRSQQ
jgi:hypothetical protein